MNKPITITEMFVSVNGEGSELGRRTAFVRTFGCHANCPGCDTMYSKEGSQAVPTKEIQADDIIQFCNSHKIKHVTFTGGEPFEQKNIHEFIKYLTQRGFQITVETNGLQKPQNAGAFTAVVSPKPWMLTDQNRDSYFYWARMGAMFKFVGSIDDVDRIRKWYRIFRLEKAYLQMWVDKPEQKTHEGYWKAYLELVNEVNKKCVDGEDIRITPQIHKLFAGFSATGKEEEAKLAKLIIPKFIKPKKQ